MERWYAVVSNADGSRESINLGFAADNIRGAWRQVEKMLDDGHCPEHATEIRLASADLEDGVFLETVPSLLSVTQTAKLLGVSRQYVLQMIDENRLHGIRIGHGWAVRESEVWNAMGRRARGSAIREIA